MGPAQLSLTMTLKAIRVSNFVGEAFANDPKVTSFSVSEVVGGERGFGQEIFYLHFGDSCLLDHRQEELHFKLSLTHVLHCLR